MKDHDPLVQRDRLRAQVRRWREGAEETQKGLAKAMDWSPSKVVRIESGEVPISTNDLRVLLDHYHVTDPATVRATLDLARDSRGPSEFDAFADVLEGGFRAFLAYERSAIAIRAFHPSVIPGLLQVERYARALLAARALPQQHIDRFWESRAQRQDLHDVADPPHMVFLIDESAIRRMIGDADTMVRQLRHLAAMAEREHVTIRVLPFTSGMFPGVESMSILEFDDVDLDDLVYVETSHDTLRQGLEKTIEFSELASRLEEHTLDEQSSIALINSQIEQLAEPAHA